MPQIERTLNLPYPPESMFALVSDIESYPSFVPFCTEAKIERVEGSDVTGRIKVGYKGLGYNFMTHNTNHPPKSIHMKLQSGPLKRLEGDWHFEGTQHGTAVQLRLVVEFSNPLFAMAFKKALFEVTDKMIQAFVNEAKRRYG